MVVERHSGEVKAYVGSADYASEERKGANNYLTAIRSTGSTLKPLIYGKALQRHLIGFDQVFDDKEFYSGGYTPTNFDNTFSGKVTLKDALIRSLNIPALNALEKVGPELFESELTTLLGNALTDDQNAGLSLAVGGYYLSAEQLVELYLKAFDPKYFKAYFCEILHSSSIRERCATFQSRDGGSIAPLVNSRDAKRRKSRFQNGNVIRTPGLLECSNL